MACGLRRVARLGLFAGAFVLLSGVMVSAQVPTKGGNDPKTTTPKDTKAVRDDTKVTVALPTLDGAELSGSFYRGNRGRDTPAVIMVHDRGKDRSKAEWDELARALQAEGYAVLTFDLRGHGTSNTVNNDFWKPVFPNLKSGFRTPGASKKNTINAADFKNNYWPWLVQDLAAARRFMELKNDAGELNANGMILIGAGDGASLGLLYLATEFNRNYRVGVVPLKSEGQLRNAGDDFAGCVWISPLREPQSGGRYNLDQWIKSFPTIREKIPMGFVVAEKDTRSRNDCENWLRTLKTMPGGRENTKRNKLIEIKGTELSGQNLLANKSLGLKEKIVEYCNEILKERKSVAWSRMEVETNPTYLVPVKPFGFSIP